MPPMINPEPNIQPHLWYQKRYHRRIPNDAESKCCLDIFYMPGLPSSLPLNLVTDGGEPVTDGGEYVTDGGA